MRGTDDKVHQYVLINIFKILAVDLLQLCLSVYSCFESPEGFQTCTIKGSLLYRFISEGFLCP